MFIAGGIGITPFRAMLSDLAAGHLPRRSTGRIDGDFIRHYVDDLLGAMFFVCGPVGLVDALVDTLTHIGVDPVRIRQEGFPGYETNPAPASAAARLA